VIALQIINMVLTGGGHESIQQLIGYKTDAINRKTDALAQGVNGNRAQLDGIKAELGDIEKKVEAIDGGHR